MRNRLVILLNIFSSLLFYIEDYSGREEDGVFKLRESCVRERYMVCLNDFYKNARLDDMW